MKDNLRRSSKKCCTACFIWGGTLPCIKTVLVRHCVYNSWGTIIVCNICRHHCEVTKHVTDVHNSSKEERPRMKRAMERHHTIRLGEWRVLFLFIYIISGVSEVKFYSYAYSLFHLNRNGLHLSMKTSMTRHHPHSFGQKSL